MDKKTVLAGAGPGDIELVTLKTLNAVKEADVILYDALIPKELLDYKKPEAELIYVGKRAGKHSMKQDEINELLLECSKKYNYTLRLKGGDPFVFGRGGEEFLYLKEHGITPLVFPGLSSATSAPLLSNIPITHRGVSTSFTVLTGHEMAGSTVDFEALAKLNGTIVVLMGIGNTDIISEKLINAGKPKNTPVAFIEKASTKDERLTITTLENAYRTKIEKNIQTPGIIVIGDVVNVLK